MIESHNKCVTARTVVRNAGIEFNDLECIEPSETLKLYTI